MGEASHMTVTLGAVRAHGVGSVLKTTTRNTKKRYEAGIQMNSISMVVIMLACRLLEQDFDRTQVEQALAPPSGVFGELTEALLFHQPLLRPSQFTKLQHRPKPGDLQPCDNPTAPWPYGPIKASPLLHCDQGRGPLMPFSVWRGPPRGVQTPL